jgi:hypothetical protein
MQYILGKIIFRKDFLHARLIRYANYMHFYVDKILFLQKNGCYSASHVIGDDIFSCILPDHMNTNTTQQDKSYKKITKSTTTLSESVQSTVTYYSRQK